MNARGEQKRAVIGSGTASHKCLALFFFFFFLCVAAFVVRSAIIALPVVPLGLPKSGLPGEQGGDGDG
jgi:hypothetical protein